MSALMLTGDWKPDADLKNITKRDSAVMKSRVVFFREPSCAGGGKGV